MKLVKEKMDLITNAENVGAVHTHTHTHVVLKASNNAKVAFINNVKKGNL